MATGNGRTLGEALIAAFKAAGWHTGRAVKGWHARLSALTKTVRGQDALVSAGLDPGQHARNWRRWLAEERSPNAENQAKIERAYLAYRQPDLRTAKAKITGEITTEGGRPRQRGITEAPLEIDHRGSDSASHHSERWSRLEGKWAAGAYDDPDEWEEAYYDDVIDDDLPFSEFATGSGGYGVVLT